MNLQEFLEEYRALTLDMLERVNKDGSIASLLEEREMILNNIKSLGVSQAELIEMSRNLKLVELEQELKILIKKEKMNTRKKIENLKKMRNANMNYMSIRYTSSRFDKQM